MINYDLIGRVLVHPLQVRILGMMIERDITPPQEVGLSPKELATLLDEPDLSGIAYHVRVLAGTTKGSRFADRPLLELVDQRAVRGATEHFYRLTPAATTPARTATWLGAQIEAMEAEIDALHGDVVAESALA